MLPRAALMPHVRSARSVSASMSAFGDKADIGSCPQDARSTLTTLNRGAWLFNRR
jgi:hypothetical protein